MTKAVIVLIGSFLLLFSLGLMMVFNTSSAQILESTAKTDIHYPLLKQLTVSIAGIGLGICFYFIGYERLIKNAHILYFIIILLLLLVFIPQIGSELKGAKRWIHLFGFSFQPSELAKYVIPLFFLRWLSKKNGIISLKEFYKHLTILAIPLILILVQPDNGTCVIIFTTLLMLFILTKIKWSYFACPLLVLLMIGGVAAYHMPHVPGRIKVYLNPELDLKGKGHQPYQAKIAAGSGRLFGKGLGKSMQKLSYLPEAKSDYIAAIYAEEFGFIGVIVLIGLYMSIAFCGYFITLKTQNRNGFYIAALITFLLSFQAFLNLGVVSGLLPSKGTTLPLFSQGGTAQIINFIAIFLLLSVTKLQKYGKDHYSRRRNRRSPAACSEIS